MAADKREIDLVVKALTRGFDKLESDLKQSGDSFGKMALKQQLAADKASLFDKEMRGLSAGLQKGTISLDDASNRAEDLARRLGMVDDELKPQKLSWTDLKSAIDLGMMAFQKVAQAAEFAYKNIAEGAQLNLAADRFDNLTASIGTTSQSMLTDLRAATKGMQSDAQLIAGATDIISLGLADTQEGTVRLATAVSTLGLDMQQVILTFANNSKARLDALGLSIEDVDAKTRELEANGFQGDAFDEAVLIALEEKMTLLGDASQTTAGQLQILESDWANLTNELKQGAAEIAGPVVSAIVANRKEAALLKDAYEKGLITYMEYQRGVSATSEGTKTATQVLTEYNLVLDENGKIIGTVTEHGVKLTAMYEKQTGAVEEATDAYVQHDEKLRDVNRALLEFSGDLGPTTRELEEMAYASGDAASSKEQLADGIDRAKAAMEAEAKAAEDAARAEEEAARAAKEHAASMGDLFVAAIEGTEGVGLFNETAAELAETTNAATLNQDALSRAIFDSADAQGASAEQLAILGGALGLYSDEAVEAALQTALIQAKIEELTAQYLAGDISVSQMRASVQDFIATINEVPTQHDIVFRITTEGSIPTIPNAPSGGQQAAAFASGTNGWVTVPGPAGAAVPIVVHGGEQMNVIPNGQTGGNGNGRGGVVQNNYFSNPQNPNAIATATAEKLGQLK